MSKEHELLFPEVDRHNEADQAPNAMEQTDLVAPDSGPKRGWRHIAGFTVCIGLWLLSIAPLVQPDEGTGIAGAAGAYLGAVTVTLGIAAVIRGVYARLRKRRFWSPWLFFIAALVAVLSLAGQTGEDEASAGTPRPAQRA